MTFESFDGAAEARMSNASADPIAEFYTTNPFPPPIDNLERALELYKDDNVRRAEFHMLWPDKEYRDDLDVLVAGCGTWQAAKHALCHPDARVVAIDVSPTSIQHTEKLKRKYNLTNLEVRQLSIESAGELNDSFDHIICTGMSNHSLVVHRNDADRKESKISFDDDCLRYVPVRLPWTICVEAVPSARRRGSPRQPDPSFSGSVYHHQCAGKTDV